MKVKKKKVDAREVIKKAYILGFEVGYYKHYDSVGWVRRERDRIEELAEKIGIEKEVERAYRRGISDGATKREQDLVQDKNVPAGKVRQPTRGLEAIEIPDMKPKFFHFPRFLRKNHR